MSLNGIAQETYENAEIATEDLNGTARYVGMGGALDALGADISTISTNPAGIGLFRHSSANVSFGMVNQQDAQKFANGNATNMSFDQVGFVYSMRTNRHSFLNVAFNYKKSRNFDYILSASDRLNGASQNKLSYLKPNLGVYGLSKGNDGTWYGTNGNYQSNAFTQLDYLYLNGLGMVQQDKDGRISLYYNDANAYMFNRANSGYIGEYDFNISGNINDRIYLGMTVGINDVHYRGYSEYTESLVDQTNKNIGDVTIADERKITGTGFNIKAGVIIRPLEYSPFRIGLSIATPTWYDLTTSNYTTLVNKTNIEGAANSGYVQESYDFKLYTPWKFGLSLGTIVNNCLAIGAGYEYADYSTLDSRINTDDGYDWYGDYYQNSESDKAMNAHTQNTLKGVSAFRVGMELIPDKNLSVRLGYNYVSPMYNESGIKDGSISSPGSFYASATDYTNWKATNRITCGVGYNVGNLSLDLAYQYAVQSGDFYPFCSYSGDSTPEHNNVCDAVKVDNKRHQLLLTLGYHF